MSTWNDLSIPEKAEMMRVAIANGITTLPEIRQAYNQFAEGGDTVGEWVDAIYQNNPKEEFLGEPEHHYDFTQSEEWADARGYYPDARGHRDDRVKKPAHPSHPSRGIWEGDKFVLSELGMQNPNYTLFGLNDGGQDPQAVLTYQGGSVIPEITATPNGNYIYNPYDNIRLSYSEGGNLFGDGSYMSKAKSLIRNNERWRATPYKDAPAGKSWRSVGYGFNDSGFRDRYPEGISKHYEKGITKAQAEKELDYYLGKAEKTLKGIYGKQWDSFNDNQKAAILDTYYQRPASVGKGSSFYNAVKAGKDGTNYLGVSGYGKRNKGRREMFSGMKDIPVTMEVPEEVAIAPIVPEEIPFTPWNPQALANEQPLITYTPPTLETPEPLVEVANAYTQEALEKEQRQRNLNTLGFVLGMTSPQGSDNSLASTISMLTGSEFAKGGKIHIKPENRGKFTALKKRTGHSATWFKQHGTPAQKKMATFALNAKKWKHGLGGNLFSGEDTPTQQMTVAPNGVITTPEGIQIFRPYYDYSRADRPLTRNANIPEIVIKPDSTLTPWERNARERERAKNHDTRYGQGTYTALRSQENTELAVDRAQREWNNSTEKKVLDAAIGLAEGVGIGSDIVATSMGGTPVYSALKGSQAFGRAVNTGNPTDYAESALWLLPELGVASREGYSIGNRYLKGLSKRINKAHSRLTGDIPYSVFASPEYREAMDKIYAPLAHAKADYPVYASAGEKEAFRNRYSRYLENSPANEINTFDFSAFNYGNEEIERLKSLFEHNPEYFVHVRDTKVVDPLSQEAIDNFINRQLTSIRGVTAPDRETAIQYLTTTETGRNMPGGDRLGTNGGLYTSNNPMIGDRFKNPSANSTSNGYVGILKEPDTIDRTKSIEEQLSQLRSRTAFGDDLLEGTKYMGNLDRSNAKMLEGHYVGRASQGTGGYERAYLPTGKRGEVASPVEIQSLEEYLNQTDQHGRWGYGLDAVVNPDLFIAKQLNGYDDYIHHARAVLTPTKGTNWDIYNTEYGKLFAPVEKRIQRRHDLIHKAYDRHHRYENAKTQAPWLLGIAGSIGGLFGSAAYIGAKNRKIDEYVENGMLRYGHENEPTLVLTARGEIDTPEDLLQIVEDSKENYQKRLERKERRNKRRKQE